MPRVAAILLAAGKSERFKDKNYKKPFAPLADRAVWLHSADRFVNRADVAQTILVIDAEDHESFVAKFGANTAILGIQVVHGGQRRSDSVAAALERVGDDIDLVAVHDAARPCLSELWIDAVLAEAAKSGAAILAVPVVNTLKRSTDGRRIAETVSRDQLWEAQTPQVFRRELLVQAYADRGDHPATDDAQLVERLGHPVSLVMGSRLNLKITTREDLRIAAANLSALPKPKLTDMQNPFANDDMWR